MEAEAVMSDKCRKRCFNAICDNSTVQITILEKKIKFDDFNVDLEAITFGLHNLSLDERKVKCFKRPFDAMNDGRAVAFSIPEKKIKLDEFIVDLEAITFGIHSLSLDEPKV